MKLIVVILAGIVLVPFVAVSDSSINRDESWAQPVNIDGVPNLYKVSDDLFRSAQPSAEGMKNLKQLGITTVVNLRVFHFDQRRGENIGLEYEHIFMKTWHPEREDIVRFLKIVTNPKKTPVLIHCQYGADRAGTMCAIYRIAVQGWTKEEAVWEMVYGEYGIHKIWKNLPEWIQNLDIPSIRRDAGIHVSEKEDSR